MRTLSLLLILSMLMSFAACTSDPAPAGTGDTADSTSADTTPAETEPPVPDTPAWQKAFDVTSADGSYTLSFSEPSVVVQGDVGDTAWGHYTFPSLTKTEDGFIRCAWHYGSDDIKYSATSGARVSVNGGKSWLMATAVDKPARTLLMENGRYFTGFEGKGAYFYTGWHLKKSAMNVKGGTLYFAEDFPDVADTKLFAGIYDPETGTAETFEAVLNWPYQPLMCYTGSLLYPTTQIFSLSDGNTMIVDGDLYVAVYCMGLNSEAKTREEAVTPYCLYSSVYVFRSTDCGRTWDYLSQVMVDADTESKDKRFEGFTEPQLKQMPDGSFVMLLRTGGGQPMYIVRSDDKGETWTKPEQFDVMGVLPQLVTLPCGVSIASYGRPELRVRATDDPAGKAWDDPVILPLVHPCTDINDHADSSCFNTSLLQLDGSRVMLAYTDFNYPNRDGEPVHTVLTRIITVKVNE